MKSARLVSIAAALAVACAAYAQDASDSAAYVDLSLGGGYYSEVGRLYDDLGGGFGYTTKHLDLVASFSMLNDGKYDSQETWESKLWNQYFLLHEGYSRFKWENFSLSGGILRNYGTVDTPYNVILNSKGHSTLGMDLTFTDDGFFYESHWMDLNERSGYTYYETGSLGGQTWMDRGANYRVIGLRSGDFRFGYEESTVYLKRSFDAMYFLSPLPSIITNSVMTMGTNPWTQSVDDNSLMGLFGEYRTPDLYLEAQFLADDINLNFLMPSNSSLITPFVNKLAWSLGGSYSLPFGRLSFYHGGATKYTYERTHADVPYEYTWYPVTSFNGSMIDITDNSMGFLYGENSLAFLVSLDRPILESTPYRADLSVALEYVINGSKSPSNPWHGYTSVDQVPNRIELFTDPVLEHQVGISGKVTKRFGIVAVTAGLSVTEHFNAMSPVDADDSEDQIDTPQAGVNKTVVKLTLAASCHLPLPKLPAADGSAAR